jgi:hypothetical protein
VTQALTNLDRLTLPTAPVNTTVELFRATLEKARDTGMPSRLLNASVERGLDAVFRDALSGRDFKPEDTPLIRIFANPLDLDFNNESGIAKWQIVQLSFYFVYFTGIQSQNFEEQRNAHIRWNLHHLKYLQRGVQDGIGITLDPKETVTWKWMPETASLDHDTPLKYLNSSIDINPASGFVCSRLDRHIQVANY